MGIAQFVTGQLRGFDAILARLLLGCYDILRAEIYGRRCAYTPHVGNSTLCFSWDQEIFDVLMGINFHHILLANRHMLC